MTRCDSMPLRRAAGSVTLSCSTKLTCSVDTTLQTYPLQQLCAVSRPQLQLLGTDLTHLRQQELGVQQHSSRTGLPVAPNVPLITPMLPTMDVGQATSLSPAHMSQYLRASPLRAVCLP